MNENILIEKGINKKYIIPFVILGAVLLLLGILVWSMATDGDTVDGDTVFCGVILIIIGLSVALHYILNFGFIKVIVTDKMVKVKGYGLTKKLDIPVDSISSVGEDGFFVKQLSIASGTGKFVLPIQDHIEVKNIITKLLTERRSAQAVSSNSNSVTNELGQYKEMLDKGMITQEDYENKKKQILGL